MSPLTPAVGRPVVRADGRAKVLGKATYSAEWDLPGLLHAVLVTAPRGPGRLMAIDTRAAARAPGVVKVLTHHDVHPKQPPKPAPGRSGPPPVPDMSMVLSDDHVAYAGQPIAIVVADTLEHARAAAAMVAPRIGIEQPQVDLEAQMHKAFPPKDIFGEPPDVHHGDPSEGWRQASTRISATYVTPAESHNPMEPHATTAVYRNGKLTVYDATQYVFGVKRALAPLCGLSPEHVRVVCRYVGGGFGSKGMVWPHVTCAGLAAVRLGKPVRLVVERRQMFGLVGFRPRTVQQLKLGARADGTLTVVEHHGTNQTSRKGDFTEPVAVATHMLYATPNLAASHRLVRLDTQTPTFQRAPGEASGMLALECAMDELAHALHMDPLELRLKNYAQKDGLKNLPFTSKALDQCYQQGARRFGWHERPAEPRSRREGNTWVGYGMATATYPAHRAGASAKVRLHPDGSVLVQTASHDLGTGTYTILSQVAADALGVPLERVRTELGDTDYPEAPVSGGSQSAASASNAVHAAGQALRESLIHRAVADPRSPVHGLAVGDVTLSEGRVHAKQDAHRGEEAAALVARAGVQHLEAERTTKPGDEAKHFSAHAWGAQFAEVRVDEDLGTIRVVRMAGAFAAGKVINPRTTRSQLLGGMVMGIGMALLEEVVRDGHQGRVVTGSLEHYMVPVNADVPEIDVLLIPEDDPHVNPLGIKGVGEIGIVGVGAAIANAVFNATGKRIRHFPLTVDKLV